MKLRHNGWMARIKEATTRKELYAILADAEGKMSDKSYNKLLNLCENRETELGLDNHTTQKR